MIFSAATVALLLGKYEKRAFNMKKILKMFMLWINGEAFQFGCPGKANCRSTIMLRLPFGLTVASDSRWKTSVKCPCGYPYQYKVYHVQPGVTCWDVRYNDGSTNSWYVADCKICGGERSYYERKGGYFECRKCQASQVELRKHGNVLSLT